MEERRKTDYDLRERMASLETNFANHTTQMGDVIKEAKRTNQTLDEIRQVLAENRGAAKAARVLWGIIVSILSVAGGFVGGIVRHG